MRNRFTHFSTVSGSKYVLDFDEMTWHRELKGPNGGELRHESGELLSWPHLQVGQGARLDDSKIRPGHEKHIVRTSDIVRIW